MSERKFVVVDVKHAGRVTHKIIAEIRDERWFKPTEEDVLRERLFEMASETSWLLHGRKPGDLGRTMQVPKPDQVCLASDDLLGLTVWDIITM
jgi:hypothetical protein